MSGKVIEFPKKRRASKSSKSKLVRKQGLGRLLSIVSLSGVLSLMIYLNLSFFPNQNLRSSKKSRGLASSQSANRNTAWEHKVAYLLGQSKRKKNTIVGGSPKAIDYVIASWGTDYRVKTNTLGKLKSIEYVGEALHRKTSSVVKRKYPNIKLKRLTEQEREEMISEFFENKNHQFLLPKFNNFKLRSEKSKHGKIDYHKVNLYRDGVIVSRAVFTFHGDLMTKFDIGIEN